MRVVPNDDADFAFDVTCLHVLTGGTVRYKGADHKVREVRCFPGQVLNLPMKRVYATGTTAGGLYTDLVSPGREQDAVPYKGSAPVNIVSPRTRGVWKVGETLTADPGTWAGYPEISYAWSSNAVYVPDANEPTYTIPIGDLGRSVWCVITARNAFGEVVVEAQDGQVVVA